MDFNCPVCNKSGLPDYTKIQTICPQCNSDLKAFFLLHSISKPKSSKTILFGLGGVAIIVCVFAILYFNSVSDKKQIVNENLNTVLQFQDSIKMIHLATEKEQKLQTETKSSKKEIVIQYKIRNGDCLSMIAESFYCDWRMYKKIETDNNLKQPYILKIGQILIIKLNHE
jgi:hypothetical protein